MARHIFYWDPNWRHGNLRKIQYTLAHGLVGALVAASGGRPCLLISPKLSLTNGGPKIKTYEATGAVLTQTTIYTPFIQNNLTVIE